MIAVVKLFLSSLSNPVGIGVGGSRTSYLYTPHFFAPAKSFVKVMAQEHVSLEFLYLQAVQKQMHFPLGVQHSLF